MFKRDYQTGFSVPLGAVRTENSPVIGEYTSISELSSFAKECGFSIIQLLPLLDTGTHSSPYNALSAFALHPIYINISQVDGFSACYESDSNFKKTYDELVSHKKDVRFDYDYILNAKSILLRKIFMTTAYSAGKKKNKTLAADLQRFIKKESFWLPSYCVYKTLKYKYMHSSWKEWPLKDRFLSQEDIQKRWKSRTTHTENTFYAWQQFVAFGQLKDSSEKLRADGIILKGDIPILLNEDSCDVWARSDVFNQKMHVGSPPDADNPTGQNWGFPCYDFKKQEENNFDWWKHRLFTAQEFFTAYRLDHIPGFFRLWCIPEGEPTAEMGHTEPCASITYCMLEKEGFSKERIRWLSQPHIPTEDFIRLCGNLDVTKKMLSLLCNRIDHEELWIFKPSVKSESDIKSVDLNQFDIDESIQEEIFRRLQSYWKNRTLIEIRKNAFVPYYRYCETKAWHSLSDDEKQKLSTLIQKSCEKQESVWKTQAEALFKNLVLTNEMIPCGEDLGVKINSMDETLNKFGILPLRVVRWCRKWEEENQPFENPSISAQNAVITTSVHDSSTMREWFEKMSATECRELNSFYEKTLGDENDFPQKLWAAGSAFTPETAQAFLSMCAKIEGAWFINPLQDWLYLDKKYYSKNAEDERINIPGTVTAFNWTWRMCVPAEKLLENKKLCKNIHKIVQIHGKIKI